MSYRIFVTSSLISKEALELILKNNCTYEMGDANDTPEETVIKLGKFQPHALIVNIQEITREALMTSSSLKAITKQGVGFDNIDIKTASELGIPVMITPFANFESVAEHTLALMLSMLRKIPHQDIFTKNGGWDQQNYTGYELFNKTLAIIGFGRIGRRLSELAAPFRMNIIVYDPYLNLEEVPDNVTVLNDINKLLAKADIVSLHCPLTSETKEMIGENELSIMNNYSWIINTARGALINESALVKALRNNKIAGAALDTFENEPPNADNPLFKLNNVIVSNHIGGLSVNSFRNMGISAFENIFTVLEGGMPDAASIVNPEVFNKNKKE